jgi:hypothetical protein
VLNRKKLSSVLMRRSGRPQLVSTTLTVVPERRLCNFCLRQILNHPETSRSFADRIAAL